MLRFPRSQRICRSEDFGRILQTRVATNKWLVLYAEPALVNIQRLGIIASKRSIPRAVDRNRVKRTVREIFRQYTSKATGEVVVKVRRCPTPDEMKEFRASLMDLLRKCGGYGASVAFLHKGLSVSD